MERIRRLRERVSSIRTRVFVETTARLALATVVNYYISQLIFSAKLVPVLDAAFKASPFASCSAFRADAERLPKMQRLWPPHSHIELTAVFTAVLYVLLRYFLRPEEVWQLLDRLLRKDAEEHSPKGSRSPLLARLVAAAVAGIVLFVLLLPMQRLAEMHLFVIMLNLAHVLTICELSAAIMFLSTEHRSSAKLKEE